MIKVENVKVYGLARAVYNNRNSFGSWDKSDSDLEKDILGPNDLALAIKLSRAGGSHAKFLRQIFVTMDITGPFFLWKELDQYKIGVTTLSESTMHSIEKNPITREGFCLNKIEGTDALDQYFNNQIDDLIAFCESLRVMYVNTKDKKYWRLLIEVLPSGWLQRRSWSGSYQNLKDIITDRKPGHRLIEWKELIDQFLANIKHGEIIDE